MKMAKLYLPTLKETPAEAEVVSHQLLLRAGMMRSLAAGVYSYLPLGFRVIKKIKDIIREAMDESGAQEVLLPVMQTAQIWKDSGRWDKFGPLMVKFYDRKEREYCLGPTHEEVITDLVRNEVRSYKDLPFNLYQIQTKVRDEIRPRYGLMRGREFIMKDAYSLDRDYEGLDVSYQLMYDAYSKIFKNCGLETRAVEADTGAMGGKDSHEFMVIADSGEDELAFCTACDYAANVEKATSRLEHSEEKEEMKPLETVDTPNKKTIDELVDYLKIDASKMIKAIALLADGEAILVLMRGDDELNEAKLLSYLDVVDLTKVADEDFAKYYQSIAGFIGPRGLNNIRILSDLRVKEIVNGVAGANEKDKHFININPARDFNVDKYLDLRKVKAGDTCPRCEGKLEIKSGIEVGHIFKLGTKYSKSMGATYLDENGKEQLIIMGSYGIGVSRLVAAAVEQNHDEHGIIWPKAIAPFQVIILPLGKDEEVKDKAEELYQELTMAGTEVLLDDRDERAGVKFNEADLIGIPLRITIGSRSLEKGIVEVQIRRTGERKDIAIENAKDEIINLLDDLA